MAMIDINGKSLSVGDIVLGPMYNKLYYGVIIHMVISTGAVEVELHSPTFVAPFKQLYVFPSTELLSLEGDVKIPEEILELRVEK